jgi:hypothetical protein
LIGIEAKVIQSDAIPAAIWEIAAGMALVSIRIEVIRVAKWQIASRLAAKWVRMGPKLVRTVSIRAAIWQLAARGRLDFVTKVCNQ